MIARIPVHTARRTQLIDITRQVAAAVARSGVETGLCVLFVPHTSAGLLLNEHADPDVARDIEDWLGRVAPQKGNWLHVEFGEENADAHIKCAITGVSQMIPVENGGLTLGTWQGIFFCEFDGPRTRELIVQVIPDLATGRA